jgi:hypothetical protein
MNERTGKRSGADHQFCGDSILVLINEVSVLRSKYAALLNVPPAAVPLSPAASALIETGTRDYRGEAGDGLPATDDPAPLGSTGEAS